MTDDVIKEDTDEEDVVDLDDLWVDIGGEG
jgi:hypothetical protein